MRVSQAQARLAHRGIVLSILATAAFGVSLLGLASDAYSAPERWDGKWDTNWGSVKLFQDAEEIDGHWECNCPDGRKAVVNAVIFIYGPGPEEETLHGSWKCPGAGAEGRGEFRIHADFAKKKRFKGKYWADGDRDNKVKWVGDKEKA